MICAVPLIELSLVTFGLTPIVITTKIYGIFINTAMLKQFIRPSGLYTAVKMYTKKK